MTGRRVVQYNQLMSWWQAERAEELRMGRQEMAQAVQIAELGPGRAAQLTRLWAVLVGLLLGIAAIAMLVSLWPYYQQLRTPCGETGFCFPPALFAHDVAVLAQHGISLTAYASVIFLLQFAGHFGYLSLAGVLFWRRRDDPMALCTVAVLAIQPLALSGFLTATIAIDGPWGFVHYGVALTAKVVVILFFALFPSGSLVPRALRWYLPLLFTVVTVSLVFEASDPLNPLVRTGVYSAETFWMLSLLVIQLYRYLKVSTPVERRQTRWLMGLLAVYCSYSIGFAWYIGTVGSPDGQLALVRIMLFALLYLLELAIVVGTVVALRRGLYNLERLVGRTVVYALLTVCLVALYVLIVGGLSQAIQRQAHPLVALVAAGAVAFVFQPLHALLQRGINQLLYGRRDEPYQVLAHLGQRLGAALSPQEVLPTVAASVREALRVPYVEITLKAPEGDRVASQSGTPTTSALSIPLVFQHEPIGLLAVGQRGPGEPFTRHERRLLEDLARQASIAAQAVRLNQDLQRSRERLVTAREEERRRLQRDLHDELGPTLASMTMQLDAARGLLAVDQAAGEELLDEVQLQLRETVGTVRRLVHQLRPPILDQLGLLAAVREQALRSERASGLQVRIDGPERLPPLGAAVEVAAYYIVVEALTNVVRHAHARRCTIRLALADGLQIEVSDDGVGRPRQTTGGVGLRSMAERATELGGRLAVENRPGGGTLVRAQLPLPGSRS
jgi:signal transduction histidine kinase